MSKKFYAVHRETREKWKPKKDTKQYLVMYDSGYLAVVTQDFYTFIEPLDTREWETIKPIKHNITVAKRKAKAILEYLTDSKSEYYKERILDDLVPAIDEWMRDGMLDYKPDK